MKRLMFLLFTCLCLILGLSPGTALASTDWPADVSIQADGGILMDADTGTVLYGKNENQAYYPASITKILTALIVLERCDLDDIVTFSHDDVYNVEAGSSSAGIDENDQLTVRDCLYALLLASANESANALACHVSGSREAFAELMNEKAASLGCTGSHFANPSGLNDENHYVTAHDMALITRAAIQNPTFLEIDGTRSYQLAPTKRSPEGGYVACHHRMLMKGDSLYYDGAFAGKTGYTSLAGNTLVTCAKRNGMTLISVILNGHQSHYTDTKALLDFGFSNFQSVPAADYETTYRALDNDMTIGGMTASDGISLEMDSSGRVTLPVNTDFSELSSQLSYALGQDAPAGAIASVQYRCGERPVGSVYLLSSSWGTVSASPRSEAAAPEEAQTAEAETESVSRRSAASADETKPAAKPSLPSSEAGIPALPIPVSIWRAALIILAALAVAGGIIALLLHRRRREQEELLLRRQRRLDRLEDIGLSSSEFDLLVANRRHTPRPAGRKRPRRRFRQKRRPWGRS